jgi:hypothetical protein
MCNDQPDYPNDLSNGDQSNDPFGPAPEISCLYVLQFLPKVISASSPNPKNEYTDENAQLIDH